MEIDRYPMRSVARLSCIWRRVMEREMRDLNLSSIQSRMLGHLYIRSQRREKVFQSELEEEFKIRKSSVTSVLQTLEKKGLVRRAGVPGDGRRRELILTEAGIASQQVVLERLDHMEKQIEDALTEKELDTFLICIHKIETKLKEAEDD